MTADFYEALEAALMTNVRTTTAEPCWLVNSCPVMAGGYIRCVRRDTLQCCLFGTRPYSADTCCLFMDSRGLC